MSIRTRILILILALWGLVFLSKEIQRRKQPVEPVFVLPTRTPGAAPEPIELNPLPVLPPAPESVPAVQAEPLVPPPPPPPEILNEPSETNP